MNNDLSVTGSILVNATADKVWEALTNPAIIKDYLYGTETITDWQVGSEVIFQGEYDGKSYRDKGMVLEYEPKERLSYTYWSGFSGLADEPENYSLISYVVKPMGDNQTAFSWIQRGYGTQEGYEHSRDGMPAFMEQVKAVMERRTTATA